MQENRESREIRLASQAFRFAGSDASAAQWKALNTFHRSRFYHHARRTTPGIALFQCTRRNRLDNPNWIVIVSCRTCLAVTLISNARRTGHVARETHVRNEIIWIHAGFAVCIPWSWTRRTASVTIEAMGSRANTVLVRIRAFRALITQRTRAAINDIIRETKQAFPVRKARCAPTRTRNAREIVLLVRAFRTCHAELGRCIPNLSPWTGLNARIIIGFLIVEISRFTLSTFEGIRAEFTICLAVLAF